MTTALDKERAKDFSRKVLSDLAGSVTVQLCAIGDQLGLFSDLRQNGPATSDVLAKRTGINERYAREWLQAMAAAGYLEVDPKKLSYTLPEEHIAPLADDAHPLYQGGMWEMLTHSMTPFELLLEAFRTGGGVSQAHFHPSLYQGMRRSSGLHYKNFLLQKWLPSMPDVVAKLTEGVEVADVGCGSGTALMTMAEAFPASTFVGYDLFPPQIDTANADAERRGMTERVRFEVMDASAELPSDFDIITTFDVIHDMAQPREALKNIRARLKPEGIYVMQEITSEDTYHENVGPQATLKYGLSITYCMTTSLANGGEGLGTLGMPYAMVRSLCEEAGFSSATKMECSNDFISLYEIRP